MTKETISLDFEIEITPSEDGEGYYGKIVGRDDILVYSQSIEAIPNIMKNGLEIQSKFQPHTNQDKS